MCLKSNKVNLTTCTVDNYRMDGLEVLTELHTLDMSHNLLTRINPAVLRQLHRLVVLKLAMNEIEQLSDMPILTGLTVLHINDNKVRTRIGLFGSFTIMGLFCFNSRPNFTISCTFHHKFRDKMRIFNVCCLSIIFV